MLWFAVFSVAGVVVLLVNLWWRKSIGQNYVKLIEELEQKRGGAVVQVSTTLKKGKKGTDAEGETVLWKTDEGFPIDVVSQKKRGAKKKFKMTLKSVSQDNRNRIFLHGVDRDSKAPYTVQLSTIVSGIKLPMYTTMEPAYFLEKVCGLKLGK